MNISSSVCRWEETGMETALVSAMFIWWAHSRRDTSGAFRQTSSCGRSLGVTGLNVYGVLSASVRPCPPAYAPYIRPTSERRVLDWLCHAAEEEAVSCFLVPISVRQLSA